MITHIKPRKQKSQEEAPSEYGRRCTLQTYPCKEKRKRQIQRTFKVFKGHQHASYDFRQDASIIELVDARAQQSGNEKYYFINSYFTKKFNFISFSLLVLPNKFVPYTFVIFHTNSGTPVIDHPASATV